MCKRQFQNSKLDKQTEQSLWHQYVYERQILNQLSSEYKWCKNWIRKRLRNTVLDIAPIAPQPVTLIADVTFFRRSFGICVFRSPHLRKNLYSQEIKHETVDVYQQGRRTLERQGFTLQAIVLDGRPGVRQVFHDIPVQMCHFHQKRIIRRYLTNNPRLPAGMELKQLMALLCDTSEDDFREALKNWHGEWGQFLKERTVYPSTGRWHYTHRRLRSAYRSLTTNLPYLFTYQKYPELAIPNTTNALDGTFAHLKELVNIHRGAGIILKTKIITEILQK